MRLFIALPLPDVMVKQLIKTQEILRASSVRGSLTAPENLHVTLKFLGEVYPDRFDAICAVMDELSKFCASVGQVKQISTLKAANIVCAKLKFDEQVYLMEEYLSKRMQEIGFEVERRAYTPHVTLMRRYAFPTPFAQVLEKIKVDFPVFTADKVCLYKSILEQGAPPRYELLYTVNLTDNKV